MNETAMMIFNGLLITALGFFVKRWINGTTERLEKKQDKDVCQIRHSLGDERMARIEEKIDYLIVKTDKIILSDD